jgi:hypothetical protein
LRTRALLALALLAAPVAACGGDDGQSRSEVIEQANAICDRASERAGRYAKDRSPPRGEAQVRAALAADVRIADRAVRELRDLDPGEEKRADFDRLVSGLRGISEGNRAFIRAIDERGDVGAANDQTLAAARRAKKAADAYGLDACPYETVSVKFGEAQEEAVAEEQDPLGTWSGTVVQYGPGRSRPGYPAVMQIRDVSAPGAPAGSIEYPTYPCGGDLRLLRSRANRYVFRERITSNRGRCTTGGRITSTVIGDRMSWRWVRGRVEVLGTLRRR